MKSYCFTVQVNGVELDVNHTASPYRPAIVNDIPERCREEEGGIVIESIVVGGVDIYDLLADSVVDEIYELILEAHND